MAKEILGFDLGIMLAENDLSSDQFKCVEISGDKQVDTCDGATDVVLGILQNKPTAGQAATVRTQGVTKVLVGTGGLTAGAKWGTAADGTAIAKTVDTNLYNGLVLIGASAGEYATVTIGMGPMSFAG